jgi:hypothetical protein
MGHVKMSQKEIKRVEIIGKAVRREIRQKHGAELLGLSVRQVKRLVKCVREEGGVGLCHRGRGQESRRRMDPKTEKKIINRYKTRYPDFGPTFAQEKLTEDGYTISRESLRKLLIKNELWRVRKQRDKPLHVWRARRSSEGELIQIDGSHHRWLEDRLDQEFCLMAYIDDATSQVYARFYEYEGVYPILDSMLRFTTDKGRPRAVYIDRHSTYKTARKTSIEEDLEGKGALTQFERVMQEIDIEVIHALTPQAKGRVERLFQTLQDRLIKEMRLANICTIDSANQFIEVYLPTYNEQFSVIPKEATPCWRELPGHLDLDRVFAKRFKRTVLNDYTIRWENRIFLIQEPSLSLKGQPVEIRQTLSKQLLFTTKHKTLSVKEVAKVPAKAKKISSAQVKLKLQTYNQSGPKSKKSWMDVCFFGQPVNPVPAKKTFLSRLLNRV